MNKEYRSAYLKHLRGAEMTEAEKRAFTVSGAGSVIPVETANEIIKKLKDQAPLLNEITLLNVKRKNFFMKKFLQDKFICLLP